MHGFWEMAWFEAIETRVIRIPVRYADFDDFWDSNILAAPFDGAARPGNARAFAPGSDFVEFFAALHKSFPENLRRHHLGDIFSKRTSRRRAVN
jgi:hypothetical protein